MAYAEVARFVQCVSTLSGAAFVASPATRRALADVEARLGVRLPAPLRELLLLADGVRFDGLAPDAITEWIVPALLGSSRLVGASQELHAWEVSIGRTLRHLLPFTSDGNGEAMVLDIHSPSVDPPVYRADHEQLERLVDLGDAGSESAEFLVAPSFTRYLAGLGDALVANDVERAWTFF